MLLLWSERRSSTPPAQPAGWAPAQLPASAAAPAPAAARTRRRLSPASFVRRNAEGGGCTRFAPQAAPHLGRCLPGARLGSRARNVLYTVRRGPLRNATVVERSGQLPRGEEALSSTRA